MGGAIKDQLGRVAVSETEQQAPAIILVHPQLGENIGAAARAMLNFGLTDLRLVAPRDGWPNPSSEAPAAGATDVLHKAKIYNSTAEAVEGLNFLMAATARRRDIEIPVMGTHEAGNIMRGHIQAGHRVGILFGPEKAGLKNEDVVLCDHILTYPINPAFHSLNLAHAVCVFGYIWKSSETVSLPTAFDDSDRHIPAKRENLLHMFDHLEAELDAAGFFFPQDKKSLMSRNIRAPFIRAGLTEQEVRTFRGIIKALSKGRGQRS